MERVNITSSLPDKEHINSIQRLGGVIWMVNKTKGASVPIITSGCCWSFIEGKHIGGVHCKLSQ